MRFYWITTINAIHHLLSFFLCVGPKRYLNMVQCNLVTHFRLSLKKLKYWRCRSNTMICNMPIYCVTSCHWWNSNFQKLVLCFILIFFWFACVNHSSNEYQVHAAEKNGAAGNRTLVTRARRWLLNIYRLLIFPLVLIKWICYDTQIWSNITQTWITVFTRRRRRRSR